MKAMYLRLGDENLLRHCLRVKTQNPNESLHSVIWRKCLKRTFLGSCVIAFSEFNQGDGEDCVRHKNCPGVSTRSKDKEKIAMRKRNSDVQEKKNRERQHLHWIHQQDILTEADGGPSYASREF